MNADPALNQTMTAEEFFAWAESWQDGERYELVQGRPVRLQAERVSHAERKASAWLAMRTAIRGAGLDRCRSFPDGVSIWVSDKAVRRPDVVVHYGPYDGDKVFAPNPIVAVEIISPSSVRTDVDRKLIDYFAVPSILHYLIVYGDEAKVVHHRRLVADGPITTSILGRSDVIDLSPPGFSVTVEALLES
ncbi:Uma2 family endonuclease [Mangrovicella endophytica]|uniref:Uma2 family endonuclease n=1 Tax=Mangrovicella endophytica TaxID=2066697 RepID=UPI000C9E1299|nr:Uma2 family endonuclease [Mangrovicella endophytica]